LGGSGDSGGIKSCAGRRNNNRGPSSQEPTKLDAKVTFPSPQPPDDEYQRWKGDPGEEDGHHQYKLEFSIYTGTGDPNPNTGDPSDIYFNQAHNRIFAKLNSQGWEYWNMTKFRCSFTF
jgi:hypothetical protein